MCSNRATPRTDSSTCASKGTRTGSTPDDITGVVVHTDLRRTGWFRCSDERINRFHEITDWSFRDNACEIPTDCPQRERAGWTGDWQLFVPSAAFLYDVAGFSLKWLRDLAVDQRPDGCVPNFAPDPARPKALAEALGDVAILARLVGLGRCSRDRAVGAVARLRRRRRARVSSGRRWSAGSSSLPESARTKRHAGRQDARPESAPHEQYLWDGGFHWGEWLEPGDDGTTGKFCDDRPGPRRRPRSSTTPQRSLAQDRASCSVTTRRPMRFDELAADVLDAWRTEYIRRGRFAHPRHPGEPRPRAGLRPRSRRAARADSRPAGRADPRRRHAPRHRLPGHAVPAARPRRHRPPRRRLRAAPPGHATVMAGHGRAGCHHRVGELGGHRPPTAPRRIRSTTTARARSSRSCTRTLRASSSWTISPGYRRFRIAPQPGGGLTWAEGRARLALRTHRVLLAYRPRPVSPDGDRPSRHLCRDRPAGRHDRRPGPRHRHPPVHTGVTGLGRVRSPRKHPCCRSKGSLAYGQECVIASEAPLVAAGDCMADVEGIRWGIAGPGAIATRFAEGMRSVAGGTVVAVGSRSAERAEAFAQRFDVARSYGSYEELAADDAVDAVYVATPPSRHAADALLFLGAGKHVLCEKPFTLNAAQTSEVVRAAREHGPLRHGGDVVALPAGLRGSARASSTRAGSASRSSSRPTSVGAAPWSPPTGTTTSSRAAVRCSTWASTRCSSARSCSARRTRSSRRATSAPRASTRYRRPCCTIRTAGSESSSRPSAHR